VAHFWDVVMTQQELVWYSESVMGCSGSAGSVLMVQVDQMQIPRGSLLRWGNDSARLG
jgi:hypothetical protein